MKRYQVIGIIALLIIAGTVSAETKEDAAKEGKAAQLGKVHCPAPNSKNSMFVVEDQDQDGVPDHVWKIYSKGPCAGDFIGNALVIK